MSFVPLYKLRRSQAQAADKLLLLDKQSRVCLQKCADDSFIVPDAGRFQELLQLELPELGSFRNQKCLGYQLCEDVPTAPDLSFVDVREVQTSVDSDLKALLLRGKPFLEWMLQTVFCSSCGALLVDHEQEEARCCPKCKRLFFPKISPAVIVLIKRDDNKILLAYNRKFRHKVYSLIAGFVESGESAEDAVRREVREEIGLEIKNIKYKYSQSWPFPDSLMLGFTAEYASGEINVDGEEIAEAAFYSIDELPPLPGHGSIARRIIEEYISENKK